MNALKFTELLNDLPDEMIDTAMRADYRRHHKIWYWIPSAAAVLVILITAAVYPKLRVQDPGMRMESSAEITETTAPDTALSEVQTSYKTETTGAATGVDGSDTTALTQIPITSAITTAVHDTSQSYSDTISFSGTRTTAAQTSVDTETSISQSTVSLTTISSTIISSSSFFTETTFSVSSHLEETTTQTQTTINLNTESRMPIWQVSSEIVSDAEKAPLSNLQVKLYHEELPASFYDDAPQNIDFSKYNYIVLEFHTVGYDSVITQEFFGSKQVLGIHLLIAPPSSADTVQKIILAAAVPKDLAVSDVTVWYNTAVSDTVFDDTREYYMQNGVSLYYEDF